MAWFKNLVHDEKEDKSFLTIFAGALNRTSKTSSTTTRSRAGADIILLLLLFSCLAEAQIIITPIASITDRCTKKPAEVIGSNSASVGVYSFHIRYPDVVAGGEALSRWDGAMEHSMPLTLAQSAKEPTLSRRRWSREVDGEYYTILLLDTAYSPFHPILHYGASNVQFDGTKNHKLSDLSPFSAYRGPGGVQEAPDLLANYEWIVAKQASQRYGRIMEEDMPLLADFSRQDNLGFDYAGYLSEERGVNATMIFSTSFRSGLCVDPTAIGVLIQEFLDKMEIALSSGGASATKGHFNKFVALVTSTFFILLL